MAVIGESGESKGWVNGGVAMAPERERERVPLGLCFTTFPKKLDTTVFVFSCFIFYFYLSDFSLGAGNHEIDQDINSKYK